MYCPKCGYDMGELDSECARCKRLAAAGTPPPVVAPNTPAQVAPPPPPPPPSASPACATCALPLLEGETLCPRCLTPLSDQAALPPGLFWIDLDRLRPLEQFLWPLQGQKITEAQLQKQIEEEGLSVADHPAFKMIAVWPDRDDFVSCTHESHNTPEKRAKCLHKQEIRIAIRTVRHHLGYLQRLTLWSNPQTLTRNAMWTCIERHRPACHFCRQREGIIFPVTVRAVPVLHPLCNCSLVQLAAGQERTQVMGAHKHLAEKAPGRARLMLANAARCGFPMGAAAGAGGCCLLVVGLAFALLVAIAWAL